MNGFSRFQSLCQFQRNDTGHHSDGEQNQVIMKMVGQRRNDLLARLCNLGIPVGKGDAARKNGAEAGEQTEETRKT